MVTNTSLAKKSFALRSLVVTFFLAIVLAPAACQPAASPAAASKLKVVATYSILGDLVQNVGGDKVAVRTLVGPGKDTHTFEPSPADGVALSEAAVIFENGLGFETWLNDLYASSGSKARRVAATQGIEPLTITVGDEVGETDPHVWHDVANVIRMVKAVHDALAQADPANADTYRANAEAYLAQLQELDAWAVAQLNTLPEDRRKLVTTHDTFGYFARRYGFEVIGSVLPTSTDGASPSARQIAALVEAVKAARVPAVFAENVSSNAILRQVADEAGVTVVASLYTDALGEAGGEGDTYLKMMRFNVTTITTALMP